MARNELNGGLWQCYQVEGATCFADGEGSFWNHRKIYFFEYTVSLGEKKFGLVASELKKPDNFRPKLYLRYLTTGHLQCVRENTTDTV